MRLFWRADSQMEPSVVLSGDGSVMHPPMLYWLCLPPAPLPCPHSPPTSHPVTKWWHLSLCCRVCSQEPRLRLCSKFCRVNEGTDDPQQCQHVPVAPSGLRFPPMPPSPLKLYCYLAPGCLNLDPCQAPFRPFPGWSLLAESLTADSSVNLNAALGPS